MKNKKKSWVPTLSEIFMRRLFQRILCLRGKGIFFSTKRPTPSVVSCLKWDRTEFNGVDVNLDQLDDNLSLEEFDRRLRGMVT